MSLPFTVSFSVPRKSTEKVDLTKPLKAYITKQYGQDLANNFAGKISELQRIRENLRSSSCDRSSHASYLQALQSMQDNKWTLGKKELDLTFKWHDAFKDSLSQSQQGYALESAAVLWNLGTLISEQACKTDCRTSQGLGRASQLYQEAAGVFSELGKLQGKLEPEFLDLTPDCLTTVEVLMLAQAQECEYLKAVEETGRSEGRLREMAELPKLAYQAATLYQEAGSALSGSYLAERKRIQEGWAVLIRFKSALYYMESLRKLATILGAEEKIGQQAAVLQRVLNKEYLSAEEHAGKVSAALASDTREYGRVVSTERDAAQRLYDLNYQERQDLSEGDAPSRLEGLKRVAPSAPADLKPSVAYGMFAGL